MNASSSIWLTILGYMALAIILSFLTHLWVRYHLKKKQQRVQLKNKP